MVFLSISVVGAADNLTDDVNVIEASDVGEVVFAEDVISTEIDDNVSSDFKINDGSSNVLALVKDNNLGASPPYSAYSVSVSDTTIDYSNGGNIYISISPASSSYGQRYDFNLKVYDFKGDLKINKNFYSSSYASSVSYNVGSTQLDPGIYDIKLQNYYDDYIMDTAKLTITPPREDSYDALIYKISNAINGSTIYLDKDYFFDSKSLGISISKQLTIDGGGHSIDGANLTRIFRVDANNVTLKNIVFKNSHYDYNTYYGNGGAIYWSGLDGTLKNCKFINCSVTTESSSSNSYARAGAVYWKGGNGKIDNCSFINCFSNSKSSSDASYAYGGAVHWNGENGVINNCNFSNCLSDSYSSKSSSKIYSYGGAVYWEGKGGIVSNCNFRQSYAKSSSMYSSSTKYSRGAAIFWSGSNGLIDNVYFINNSKTEDGIIYAAGDYLRVTSSLFSDNYRNCIYWTGSEGSVDNSIFITNTTYYPVYSSNYQVLADYNWWGNTVDDYSVKVKLPSKIIVNNWLYLDVIPDSPLNVGQTGKIKFNLNNLVSDGRVSKYNFKLPNVEINIKSNESIVKSTIIKRGIGEISYTAVNTPKVLIDVNVKHIKKQINITVVKGNSKIIAANLKTVYHGGKYLKVILNDKYGHMISGATVTVKINGKAKKYVTNSEGEIKITVNNLAPKSYTAKIEFKGDKNYYKSSTTSKITVKKATPKITFSKQTFYDNVKKKKVSVTLNDNAGVVKNVKLSLVINKKTFTAKTNSKGLAQFKVTNLAKIGTYGAVVKFAGNSKYNSISKKSKVSVKKAPKFKTITISTKMSDSGERVTKTYDNFVIQTEKFQHAFTTLCVFVYKDGKMLNRNDYSVRFQYNEAGVWKWAQWSHGTQAAVYYKIADSISNDILVGNVQVKIKV